MSNFNHNLAIFVNYIGKLSYANFNKHHQIITLRHPLILFIWPFLLTILFKLFHIPICSILQLNDLLLLELKEIAEKLEVSGYKRLGKQDLIRKILDHQAKTPTKAAPEVVVEAPVELAEPKKEVKKRASKTAAVKIEQASPAEAEDSTAQDVREPKWENMQLPIQQKMRLL